jgi:hypothetical protein
VKAFVAVIALGAVLAFGAAPPAAIPGPGLTLELPQQLQAEPGALIVLEARTSGRAVRWVAMDEGLQLVPAKLLASPAVAVAVAARPGVYRVLAVAGAGDELTEPAVCVITVGTREPPLRPPAAPPGKAWLVIVEETAAASAHRGALLGSKDVADYLRARAWRARVADKDVRDASGRAPADLAPYLARARGCALPRLFVVCAGGKLLFEGDMPATPAGLLALLKGLGG